jgi:hypothetical protein
MGRPRWTSRLTVDDCYQLDAGTMAKDGVFTSQPGSEWKTIWNDASGAEMQCSYVVTRSSSGCLVLRFDSAGGLRTDLKIRPYMVEIVKTQGKHRFRCPIQRNSALCGKLVARLYLPPGERVFGCRSCHWLTYSSCQTHDSRKDALLRDPSALAAALDSPNARRRLLGVGAYAQALRRLQRLSLRSLPRRNPILRSEEIDGGKNRDPES